MKPYQKTLIRSSIVLLLIALLYLAPVFLVHIRPAVKVKPEYIERLRQLADSAKSLGEFPTAALVLYDDRIIGSGINSIQHQHNALGHAEMNAIQSILDHMTLQEFRKLDLNKLIFLTSWEPCPMCSGTLEHFNIRNVYCLKTKKISWQLHYRKKELKYYFGLRRIK
ncbi:MAG: nucleoside deaminase [Bacteroidales bacterium]|nr:nucleoside deaminase [Bacteroidales bacterium]